MKTNAKSQRFEIEHTTDLPLTELSMAIRLHAHVCSVFVCFVRSSISCGLLFVCTFDCIALCVCVCVLLILPLDTWAL